MQCNSGQICRHCLAVQVQPCYNAEQVLCSHFDCLGVHHGLGEFSLSRRHTIRIAEVLRGCRNIRYRYPDCCHLFLLRKDFQSCQRSKTKNQLFNKECPCRFSQTAQSCLHHCNSNWLIHDILDANFYCMLSRFYTSLVFLRCLACYRFYIVGQFSSEPMGLCSS